MVRNTLEKAAKLFRHPRTQSIFIFFSSATIVLLSIFPSGLESVHFGVSFLESPNKMSDKFGYSDAGSYLKAALELESINMLSQDQLWVINLWPPGMVLLEALILKFAPGSLAIGYALIVAGLWTVLAWVFAREVRKHYGLVVSYLALFFLLLSSPLQSWVFDSGLYYAEGISVGAYIFGLLFLIRGSGETTKTLIVSRGIIAGTFLALSAYFRSTFSSLESVLFVSLIVVFSFYLFTRNSKNKTGSRLHLKNSLLLIFATWSSMFILMEPWLQFTNHFVRNVRAWSVVGGNFFRNVWVDRGSSPDFLSAGGVGWGCELDQEFCDEVANFEKSSGSLYPIQDLVLHSIGTIAANPVEYFLDRFHFLIIGWFSNEGAMGAIEMVTGLISLVIFAYVLGQLFILTLNKNPAGAFVILACALITAPLLIGHVEPRYFIPLKLSFILLPWIWSKFKVEKSI